MIIRMTAHFRPFVLFITFLLAAAGVANAQTSAPASGSNDDDWKVAIYPILAWVPVGIGMDLDVPPTDGGGSGAGGGSAEIIDSRFDGAYLGGFTASKGWFRIDADGLWAAVGGDRPELPFLRVDVDVIYYHVSGGVKVAPDFYLTAGVRRFALKYNVQFADQPEFERKPGVWDPLIGVGYHKVSDKYEVHTTFEGGGFGVGADVDLAGMFRVDWKPVAHFGLTAGYNYLYFKVEDELRNRTFTVKQTLHGPIVGIGLYF
jgi:hypothetical protein